MFRTRNAASHSIRKLCLRSDTYPKPITNRPSVFGVDDGTPRSDFYISPMDGPAQQPIPTHIAFRATNEQAVRDFYEAAITAGGMDNGRPGPRAYHSGYYAAFVLDPDGNNIEAVTDWSHTSQS